MFAVLLVIIAGEKWRLGRRRHALNRALHEVRRPLQALALLSIPGDVPASVATRTAAIRPTGGPAGRRAAVAEPVLQAISAVSDLDRELNGGPAPARRMETVAARLMADACVRRWRSRAALSGKTLELRWPGPDSLVRGDGVALASALENLIVNAIEHGGPTVTVAGRAVGRRVRIEVLDDGVASRPPDRGSRPARAVATGRAPHSHGHGLEVADRIATENGGRLETDFARDGSRAVMILPRSMRQTGHSAAVRVNW
jgi:signal transduction histidine kinase